MLTLYAPADPYGVEAALLPFPTKLAFPSTATAPITKAATKTATSRRSTDAEPTLLAPHGDAWLLVEAIELAEWLGWRVIESELEGEPTGVRWSRGRKQLWLELTDAPSERLAVVAEALRGEPVLTRAEMSPELAAYLTPRRAA